MLFKRYAVLITITSNGKNYYYDRFIVARTHNEAHKVAQKLANVAYNKQSQKFANSSITEIKILEE